MDKTIYKKDTKDRIRQLRIFTEGPVLNKESGLLGGKLVTHSSTCKAKNVGKANATTPEEQAEAQAKAVIVLKLREGYFETVEDATNEVVELPMLAKEYSKEASKVDWKTAYVQPKLDGMRCLKRGESMTSRKNVPITTMGHIAKKLADIPYSVDGELYAHGLSFQDNMKLIKKERADSVKVKFHVYDLIMSDRFEFRNFTLNSLFDEEDAEFVIVPTYKVNSEKELEAFHAQFLEEGYEGTMLRWGNDGYKVNGRSSSLLKYKDFLDEAYLVIDVIPSDKDPLLGVVQCVMGNGKIFKCGMKFPHKERKEILKNKKKYIGKKAEVRFFEFTDDGIPRFPVCVGFRLDK